MFSGLVLLSIFNVHTLSILNITKNGEYIMKTKIKCVYTVIVFGRLWMGGVGYTTMKVTDPTDIKSGDFSDIVHLELLEIKETKETEEGYSMNILLCGERFDFLNSSLLKDNVTLEKNGIDLIDVFEEMGI